MLKDELQESSRTDQNLPMHRVGRDGKPTYPENEPTSCETVTASICSTTEIESITVTGTRTSTSTSTSSSCEEFTACGATDEDSTETTTTSPDSCPLPTGQTRRGWEQQAGYGSGGQADLDRRQVNDTPPPPGCPADAFVYPRNPRNVGNIPQLLEGYEYREISVDAESGKFTSFFWVSQLRVDTLDELRKSVS